ncbi:MAG: alpha/beta fold hydrolase [Actinomycetota bacterium]
MAEHYGEFSLLHENASEVGLAAPTDVRVERVRIEVGPDQGVSAIRWGTGPAEMVLLHGGAQNAHTWDTVALALGRPVLAIDLPGHGHSDWREDRAYWPAENAHAVAVAVRALAPEARVVTGMSLGGLTALSLAHQYPDLVAELVLVDITPGVTRDKAAAITSFVNGPESFGSFEELLERTITFNPTRSESSLRRGVLHNAAPRPDGTWAWRYDRNHLPEGSDIPDFGSMWDAVDALTVPLTLLRGADSPVVDDADVAELRRRRPEAAVIVIEGAGHSIQGDRPVELAAHLTVILER